MRLGLDFEPSLVQMAANWKRELGFEGTLMLEPKPQEPTKHQVGRRWHHGAGDPWQQHSECGCPGSYPEPHPALGKSAQLRLLYVPSWR